MKSVNRQATAPIRTKRTRRDQPVVNMTSMPAGKFVPLAFVPLLREDAVVRAAIDISVEMMETHELLMNPVYNRYSAFLVPLCAMERFGKSMDQFNRSYMGEPQIAGGAVVPFFQNAPFAPAGFDQTPYALYRYAGLHTSSEVTVDGRVYDPVNSMYIESYNMTWNWLAKNRSPDIAQRLLSDTSLAPAFWINSRFDHIVPDFDQAQIDGEVPLSFVAQRVPVRGLGIHAANGSVSNLNSYEYGGEKTYPKGVKIVSFQEARGGGDAHVAMKINPDTLLPELFAELDEAGVSISLANIEVAKKTRVFAKLREQFDELDEDWVIDLLMSGIHVPDQNLMQPIRLGSITTKIRQGKRYSTTSGALDESVVSGAAGGTLSFRVPRLHTGGVIVIVGEAVPEQIWERQEEPFLKLGLSGKAAVERLPDYLRDYLDPEKVVTVPNSLVDAAHSDPEGLFGYAPLNHEWWTFGPRLGGKFYRPVPTAPDVDARNRVWATETVDPKLSENFYIVSEIHTKPFLHPTEDPFEVVLLGGVAIEGNTQRGNALVESDDNYDAIAENVPMDRIEKEGP